MFENPTLSYFAIHVPQVWAARTRWMRRSARASRTRWTRRAAASTRSSKTSPRAYATCMYSVLIPSANEVMNEDRSWSYLALTSSLALTFTFTCTVRRDGRVAWGRLPRVAGETRQVRGRARRPLRIPRRRSGASVLCSARYLYMYTTVCNLVCAVLLGTLTRTRTSSTALVQYRLCSPISNHQ